MNQTRDYRFFVTSGLLSGAADGSLLALRDEALSHQIRNVLRLRDGDSLTLLDGEQIAKVRLHDGKQAKAGHQERRTRTALEHFLVVEIEALPPKHGPTLAVAMPLIKPARFEFALEKLTELGVEEILPFYCTRLVAKPEKQRESMVKIARMEAIIKEASEQCERLRLPLLHQSRNLTDMLATSRDFEQRILLSERSEAPNLVHHLCNPGGDNTGAPEKILLLLGPEGGFTAEELEKIGKDFSPVSLGKQILRSETAAIVAAALVIAHIMNKD